MITLDKFEEILREGSYETPAECRPARRLPRGIRAWWRFYVSGVLHILLTDMASKLRRGYSPRLFSEVTYRTIQAAEATGAVVKIEGLENLSRLGDTPRVYVANHASLLETFHLPCILNPFGAITIIAKRSLSKYPLFGKCLRAIDPILLDRKNARHDLAETLSQGRRHLASGRSVLLFPQGTRTPSFNPAKFNSLGAKLAISAGAPLVPIACKTDFAIPGRLIKDLGPIDPSRDIRYAIGAPASPELGQHVMQRLAVEFISRTIAGWNGTPGES